MSYRIKNKLVIRRVMRRGTTCRYDRRGNLILRQVVSTLFLCPYVKEKNRANKL